MKTFYGAWPYWQDGRRLVPGTPEQFKTKPEAERAAERLYENHAGVVVYSVTGCPEFDTWGDPHTLSVIGLVPIGAALA